MGGKKREEEEQNNSEYGKTVSECDNCHYGCISVDSSSISLENNAMIQQTDHFMRV